MVIPFHVFILWLVSTKCFFDFYEMFGRRKFKLTMRFLDTQTQKFWTSLEIIHEAQMEPYRFIGRNYSGVPSYVL